jgi:hypothetical protein
VKFINYYLKLDSIGQNLQKINNLIGGSAHAKTFVTPQND